MSIPSDIPGSPHSAANEALVAFYSAHHDNLQRFLRTRVGDPDEELRIAQKVYLDLLQNPPASLNASYLFEAAENLAKDPLGLRSTRDRLRRLIFFELQAPRAGARQERDQIWRALQDLPPACARAIHLVYEFDYQRAAQMMNLNSAQVQKLVARTTEYLQDFLSVRLAARRDVQ